MDIPKSFKPNKNLEKATEQLLEGRKRNSKIMNELLISCGWFLEKKASTDIETMYNVGRVLANDIGYTKSDLEELSENITEDAFEDRNLGFYLSALINKVITENDKVVLKPKVDLTGLGVFLQRGKLIIKGDVLDYTGAFMRGGMILVKGNIKYWTGYFKQGGLIVIEGNEGMFTAFRMRGGNIWVVKGDAEDPEEYMNEDGEIIFNENVKRMYLPNLRA